MKNKAKALGTMAAIAMTLTTATMPVMAATGSVGVSLGAKVGVSVGSNVGVSVKASTNTMAETQNATMTAADLRVTLDQLLGEHAVLAILAMEEGYNQSADFSAVASALSQNTDDLSAAISLVYGPAAGAQFKKIWSDHIGNFVSYVTATAKHDSAGQKEALSALADYKVNFAKFLAGANPNLDASVLEGALQTHIDQLVTTFNDYVNKDYTGAAKGMVEAYQHMFMTGDVLAEAIVKQYPSKFADASDITSPAANLRVTLDQLLGEHADLAVIAMAKGYSGAPDFSAVDSVLSQNTSDLAGAIASVYGSAAGTAFQKIWSDHIGNFVAYVEATAKHDPAGQKQALDALAEYKLHFAQFLAGANPNLDPRVLEAALQTHIHQLVTAFNDYVNKDYTGWATFMVKAYSHMFMTGDVLSAAIAKQYPFTYDASMLGSWPRVDIWVNGKAMESPLAWLSVDSSTNEGTAWIPIWYLMQSFKQYGIQSHWNGVDWRITVPNSWKSHLNLSASAQTNLTGSGVRNVYIDGKLALQVHGTATADPYSKVRTEYVSTADLNGLFNTLGIQSSWDGVNLALN